MSKKAVFTVLAAMLAVLGMVASQAMAIDGLTPPGGSFINPGGLGDSLIFGYYNVRGNINLFNIVNTSPTDGAKVRVVFREGKTSREVLDFAVCLSRTDVWTAFLVDGGATAAVCSIALLDADTITAPAIPPTCQTFKIPTGTTLTNDDLREGYFEVLGLSSIPNYDKNAAGTAACTATSGPQNCIRTALACSNWNSSTSPAAPPVDLANVLMGNNFIFALADLSQFSYNATAIANTTTIPTGVLDPGPGQELGLALGVATGGCLVENIFAKSEIISPYDIKAELGGATELIITFPTRRQCHANDVPGSLVNNLGGGVGNLFTCTTAAAGVCTVFGTPVNVAAFDEKENAQTILQFSPAGDLVLPNEVNVLRIGAGTIWDSTLVQSFSINFTLGWVNIGLTKGLAAPLGLPTIAYTTQSFVGGGASYMVPTAYRSAIAPVVP